MIGTQERSRNEQQKERSTWLRAYRARHTQRGSLGLCFTSAGAAVGAGSGAAHAAAAAVVLLHVVGQGAQDPDHAQHAVEVPPNLAAQPGERHAPDGVQLGQEVLRLHLVLQGREGRGCMPEGRLKNRTRAR